jgi:hypothetical protein
MSTAIASVPEEPRGILSTIFGNKQDNATAQHHGQLVHMGRELELAEERLALINEAGREAVREVAMTAMARNQAIQLDPAGAEVYFAMWMQTAQDSQAVVHRLARRLG